MNNAGPPGQGGRPPRAQEDVRRENEKLNQQRAHRAAQKALDERLQRQKNATAHYLETPDGRAQMRQAVRGEEASRPDGKILSHGFNAQASGPVEKQKLENQQRAQQERLRDQQTREQRRREAQKVKDQARNDFNRAAKDDRGR